MGTWGPGDSADFGKHSPLVPQSPSPLVPSCNSEADVHREQVIEPAQIEPGAREVLVGRQISLSGLIANLAADGPGSNRHAYAAENHRARRGAAADERAAEDRAVGREELARFDEVPSSKLLTNFWEPEGWRGSPVVGGPAG